MLYQISMIFFFKFGTKDRCTGILIVFSLNSKNKKNMNFFYNSLLTVRVFY